MKDIVYVKGNIIAKSGYHKMKELIAFASDEWKEIAEIVIDQDLILTDKDKIMPYKIYCASEDISTYGNFLSGLQSPNDTVKIFQKEIESLQKLRSQKILEELEDVMNRQVFIGVVSTLELFLCDFLESMVLGYKKYFKLFIENSIIKVDLKEVSNEAWRIQNVIESIIEGNNYHRIDDVKVTYEKVLGVKFPPIEKLQKLIRTRHSLVHRNGFRNEKTEYIKVTSEMIDELIYEVKDLVTLIIKSKQLEIKKWIPDPIKR